MPIHECCALLRGGHSVRHFSKRTGSSHEWLKRQHSDLYVKAALAGNYRARSFAKLLELQERYSILHAGSLVLELGAAPGGWSQVASEIVHRGSASLAAPAAISLDALPLAGAAAAGAPRTAQASPAGRASILSLGALAPAPAPAQPAALPSASSSAARAAGVQPSPLPLVVALDLLPIAPIPGVQVVLGNALRPDLIPALRRAVFQAHSGRMPTALLCDMAPSFTGEAGTDQLRQMALSLAALHIALAGGLQQGGNLCVKVRYGQGYAQLRASMRARFSQLHEAKPPASRAQSAEAYLVGLGFQPLPWSTAEAAFLAAFGVL